MSEASEKVIMNTKAKIWKFGDNINTDDIIPARYLNTSSGQELSKHCMEDIYPEFAKKVQIGDIIVGGENFGCGSSREHAPISIKNCGISCIVAKSFARIFFRNCINIGLPILEISDAYKISNDKIKEKINTVSYPEFIQNIIRKGGLIKTIN